MIFCHCSELQRDNYIFIYILGESEIATLVRMAVENLMKSGVLLTSVTCDGPPVQLAAMRLLGAEITPGEPVHTRILHDLPCPPIYFILDAVHSMKLIRNSWKSCKFFLNSAGAKIDWNFIVKLVDMQEREGLRCANKLTRTHVNFKNVKNETLPGIASVFKKHCFKLRYSREKLNIIEFQGSESTKEFLLNMNDL